MRIADQKPLAHVPGVRVIAPLGGDDCQAFAFFFRWLGGQDQRGIKNADLRQAGPGDSHAQGAQEISSREHRCVSSSVLQEG